MKEGREKEKKYRVEMEARNGLRRCCGARKIFLLVEGERKFDKKKVQKK